MPLPPEIDRLIPSAFAQAELSSQLLAFRQECVALLREILAKSRPKDRLAHIKKQLRTRFHMKNLKTNMDFWYVEACAIELIRLEPGADEHHLSLEQFQEKYGPDDRLRLDLMHHEDLKKLHRYALN